MSQKIILKRTAVPGRVPTTSNIELGELGINTTDGRAFLNQSGSSVEEFLITNTGQPVTGSLTMSGSLTIEGDVTISNDNPLVIETTDVTYSQVLVSAFSSSGVPPNLPPDGGQAIKVGNKIFYADYWYNVLVYDADTFELYATSSNFTSGAFKLAYNPTLDRVYVGGWDLGGTNVGYMDATTYATTNVALSGSITVFDGTVTMLFDDTNQFLYALKAGSLLQYDADFTYTGLTITPTLDVDDIDIYSFGIDESNGNLLLTSRDAIYVYNNTGSLLNKNTGYKVGTLATVGVNGVVTPPVAGQFIVWVTDRLALFNNGASTPVAAPPYSWDASLIKDAVGISYILITEFKNNGGVKTAFYSTAEYPGSFEYGYSDGVTTGNILQTTPLSGVDPVSGLTYTNSNGNLVVYSGGVTDAPFYEVDTNFASPNLKVTLNADTLTDNRTILFPNTNGTLALTSDLNGVISSSAQIASDISGSVTSLSSSISTRVTTLETQNVYSGSFSGSYSGDGSGLTNLTLPSGILSSSAQIATEISGAFDNTSSSLASRVTTLETQTIYSGSFSGSFEGDGTNLTLSAGQGSYWTGSNGVITRDSDVQITGSLNLSGDLILGAPDEQYDIKYVSGSYNGTISFNHKGVANEMLIAGTETNNNTTTSIALRNNRYIVTVNNPTENSSISNLLANQNGESAGWRIQGVSGSGDVINTGAGNIVGGFLVSNASFTADLTRSMAIAGDFNGLTLDKNDTLYTNQIDAYGNIISNGKLIISGSGVQSNIWPTTDNSFNIGTSSNRWATVYGVTFSGSVFSGSFVGDGSALTGIVSEWVTYTGTRSGADILVTIGDYDSSGNGTYIRVDDDNQQVITNGDLMTNGWNIVYSVGATIGTLTAPTLSSTRTWTLPDATGTVALTSDLSAFATTGSNNFNGNQVITGSLTVSGSVQPFTVYGSGSDVMRVIGSTGTLFTIDDDTSGNVLEVANGSGYNQLVVEANGDMLTGDEEVVQTLHRTSYLLTSANVSQSITTFVTSSYTAAFIDYTVSSGSNARAGSIMSVWNGANLNYTETSTTAIGDTTGVSFTVELSASLATLRSVTTTNNWTIKTTTRAI